MHHPTDRIYTYHSLCYTSCGALAGTRNSSIDPPRRNFYMHHPTDRIYTYHSLCYTSCGALAGTRNSSIDPPRRHFICTTPQTGFTHTTAFVTPVVEHWLEQEIAPLIHHEGLIRRPLYGLLFPISSKGMFICTTPQTGFTHTTAFVTPVVEHWLKQYYVQSHQIEIKIEC